MHSADIHICNVHILRNWPSLDLNRRKLLAKPSIIPKVDFFNFYMGTWDEEVTELAMGQAVPL